MEVFSTINYKANQYGFSQYMWDLQEYIIEKHGLSPRIFEHVIKIVKKTCDLCEHLEKPYEVAASILNPQQPAIRIETNQTCAIGEKIYLDAKEFVSNPLSCLGRCPRDQSIPVVRVRDDQNGRYIEELGGCGRVVVREGDRRETIQYGGDRVEHSVFFPAQEIISTIRTLPNFLETYVDLGLLSPDDIKEF